MHGVNSLNTFIGDGVNYWRSTSTFIPSQNSSYGTIQLRSALYMELDIVFHGKRSNLSRSAWENVFRIGHAGYAVDDHQCSKNDRFPALWVDDDSHAFVFDISDKTNCFRQYTQYLVEAHTLYRIIIEYNSSWVQIRVNDSLITDQPRFDTTHSEKLGDEVGIWISTVTALSANVHILNMTILSLDDDSSATSLAPTLSPSTQSPSSAPTQIPTNSEIFNTSPSMEPTRKPTTFFPTVFTTQYLTTEDNEEDIDDRQDEFAMSSTVFVGQSTSKSTKETASSSNGTVFVDEQDTEKEENNNGTKHNPPHREDDETESDDMNSNPFSFEVIFYILTGCAMGGILFCI
eukprot:CAMPEP_0197077344 /NCGR_PEP_ID=MMETSP1384-20130603/212575_1 /TAXON_ID=29189 /ORGANISM="Ammonia sp." /LENGTH=345 /DNA_ID=CAMNT_0042516209 /DNA_START=57 /DNA_END=1091 /DNA_ORIENTATION=+